MGASVFFRTLVSDYACLVCGGSGTFVTAVWAGVWVSNEYVETGFLCSPQQTSLHAEPSAARNRMGRRIFLLAPTKVA